MSIQYNTVIAQEGLQASIENSKDRNGFSIKINSVEIMSRDKSMGRFPCTGILRGSNSITVNALVTGDERYDITQINLIDGISGKVFANVKRQDDGVIDNISDGKTTVLLFTVGFMGLPENTVTVKVNQGNDLIAAHNNSDLAHINRTSKMLDNVDVIFADSSQQEAPPNKLASARTGVEIRKKFERLEPETRNVQHYTTSSGNYTDIFMTIHQDAIIMPDGMMYQTAEMRNVNMSDRSVVKHLWELVTYMDIPIMREMKQIIDVQVSLTAEHPDNYHPLRNVAAAFLGSWDVTMQKNLGNKMVRVLFSQFRNVNTSIPVNVRIFVKGIA